MFAPVDPSPVLPPRAARVLVVDLGFLGDTLHLVPALQELRRHHAGARLEVLTTAVGAQVLELVGGLDRVWVYPLGNPSPPWWRHWGLQHALWRERFDLAVNFSGADRTLFAAAFAGIPRRLTRTPVRRGRWRRWLAGTLLPAPSRELPVYEQRRAMLAAVGYQLEPARFDLQVPQEWRAWAAARVPAGAVHLSVNASSATKEWPIESWTGFCRAALASGIPALLATGSAVPRERARLAELASAVDDARLRVIDETLRIPQLAALVAACRLHVGTDSGVTHLAMAFGLPTVSLFREYAGLREWAPRGPAHQALTEPCRCVDRPQPDPVCARTGVAECLARITPAAVLRAAQQMLSRSPWSP